MDFLFLLFLLSCEAILKAAGPGLSRVSVGSVVAPVGHRSLNFQNLEMSESDHVTVHECSSALHGMVPFRTGRQHWAAMHSHSNR